MSNDTVVSLAAPARVSDPLTELLRSGAGRLIKAAVTAEFEEYLSGFVQEKLPDGRQRVVRNGHLPEHKILTGLGEVGVRVPNRRSSSAPTPGPSREGHCTAPFRKGNRPAARPPPGTGWSTSWWDYSAPRAPRGVEPPARLSPRDGATRSGTPCGPHAGEKDSRGSKAA